MREIKFRAWDSRRNKMVSPEIGDDVNGLNTAISIVQRRYENLMQYTGLKDVNDNEIYEGDKLLIECLGDEVVVDVFYNEGLFWAGQVPLIEEYKESKVMGNIYEK